MSEGTQFTTFADLYQGLLRRVRVTTGISATDTQAKHYINVALQDIHLGFDYKLPWCERTAILRTKAPYTTGTVAVSVGSTTVTGTSTLWNTNNSYGEPNMASMGKIIFEGSQDIYRVSTVSSDTSAVLVTKYVGSAALSGASYTYFEDEYLLNSGFLRSVDAQLFSPAMRIPLISRADFRRRYPVVRVSGPPRVACIIDSTFSNTAGLPFRRIAFYPYPDQTYNIPYTYITSTVATTNAGASLTDMTSDTDLPTMPLRYRHAILYHALAHWYRDRKDDARSEAAKAEYTDIMNRIVNDHDVATHTTVHLQPSGGYKGAASRPYSRRGGRRIYDLNDEFDSFKR